MDLYGVENQQPSEQCFLLKAPDTRGVTLRRDSVTCSRARRRYRDGSEPLRSRDSNTTTATTHQVGRVWHLQATLHIHFESTTVTSHSHLYTLSLFSLSVSTFPVPFTCERKQDHSRPDQSRLPAHSELPGNKTPLFLAYRKNPQQLHDNSFVVSSLNRWVSTIMLGQNMEICRSRFRITRWVGAQRCGTARHNHRWKRGCERWFSSPAITVFRSVFKIDYDRVLFWVRLMVSFLMVYHYILSRIWLATLYTLILLRLFLITHHNVTSAVVKYLFQSVMFKPNQAFNYLGSPKDSFSSFLSFFLVLASKEWPCLICVEEAFVFLELET